MSDDDRASRLRKRRQQAHERATSQSESSNSSDSSSTPTEPDDATETSVKDEQVGTYMYLPEWQKKEIDRVYGLLKTQYEYEFDTDFEKNRHFFPLLVQYGIEALDGASTESVRRYLEELDE